MNGGWKRKIQGSACVVIATACLVVLTGIAPGPLANLWGSSHGASGSTTVVFAGQSGSSLIGHSREASVHAGVIASRGLTQRLTGSHAKSASG